MNPKLIQDIRLFELDVPNVSGNSLPGYMGKLYRYESLNCQGVILRLLFLLRHRNFEFDGFDHLYLNFTPCLPHGEVEDANRSSTREFDWYHYVNVGCDRVLFNGWQEYEKTAFVLDSVKKAVLIKVFNTQCALFEDSFAQVLANEELLIPYKRKENQSFTVEVLTRISNKLDFQPLLRVTDKNATAVAEQSLRAYGRDEFISQIGTITIGKRSVRIAPRKNWYAEHFELMPIKIEW